MACQCTRSRMNKSPAVVPDLPDMVPRWRSHLQLYSYFPSVLFRNGHRSPGDMERECPAQQPIPVVSRKSRRGPHHRRRVRPQPSASRATLRSASSQDAIGAPSAVTGRQLRFRRPVSMTDGRPSSTNGDKNAEDSPDASRRVFPGCVGYPDRCGSLARPQAKDGPRTPAGESAGHQRGRPYGAVHRRKRCRVLGGSRVLAACRSLIARFRKPGVFGGPRELRPREEIRFRNPLPLKDVPADASVRSTTILYAYFAYMRILTLSASRITARDEACPEPKDCHGNQNFLNDSGPPVAYGSSSVSQ
jgi:hypothetical protein